MEKSFSSLMFFSGFSVKAWKIKPRVMGHSCVPPLRPSIAHQLSRLRDGDHSSLPFFPLKGKSVHLIENRCLAAIFPHSLFSGRLRSDEEILSHNCILPLSHAVKSLCRQFPVLNSESGAKEVGVRLRGGDADEEISSFEPKMLSVLSRAVSARSCFCSALFPTFLGDPCR